MSCYSGLFKAKCHSALVIRNIILISGIGLFLFFGSSCSTSDKKNQSSEKVNTPLAYEAEDLNAVLPQRIALNTYFDSVGIGDNQLHYYYSVSDLTKEKFIKRELNDSLYAEAVERIPCTLWRPLYMQGVEVSFTYYASDGAQLLHFVRQQENCNQ